MPVYEYRCVECELVTEEIQRMDDPPLTRCEVCGNESLQKQLSVTSFKFEGTGFYETDYREKK